MVPTLSPSTISCRSPKSRTIGARCTPDSKHPEEDAASSAQDARDLRAAERMRIWREVDDPNMLAYIERVLGYGPRAAYDRMRVARELGELPSIEHALERGELFYSMARELTRVAIWETAKACLPPSRERACARSSKWSRDVPRATFQAHPRSRRTFGTSSPSR
jgi:hypothetical protein